DEELQNPLSETKAPRTRRRRSSGVLAAEQGYAASQCGLGFMYNNGCEVDNDKKETVKWYTLAADQGHADSQHNLGTLFRDRRGGEKIRKRHEYFTKAGSYPKVVKALNT
ncbi:UNVERIFIED_CONTAM: hypothetical protein HDU68_004702, partial [Siphonaria sp. JEL0065]